MIEIISKTDKKRRAKRLSEIAARSVALDDGLLRATARILEDVRTRGDEALIEYASRFDGVRLEREEIRFDVESLRAYAARVEPAALEALREAVERIRAFHARERQESWEIESAGGVRLGQRVTPIQSAGLYVPGGSASYPSSVLMNVIPAQTAGVPRIAVATPPRTLKENPTVAAALLDLGVTEIYQIGGAQAVAALAYGTESVPRVDKITGPGNKYVAAAKKLVFGSVGIDSIAGPSEVVIIADDSARADYVAADMLAQAEHDEEASAVLLTTSDNLAASVARELERQTKTLPRRAIIESSLQRYGAIIVSDDAEELSEIANSLAPEHLQIIARDEEALARKVLHAGAIFFGEHTPEAVGDYFAGPNHVLPTSGAARFSSALGVNDFLRRTSILKFSSEEMRRTARTIATLARSEGLEAHARSALMRLEGGKSDA